MTFDCKLLSCAMTASNGTTGKPRAICASTTLTFSTRERFWVTFQASNWTGIPMLLLTLPFIYLGVANVYPREQMMKVLSIVGAYGYLFVEACVLFRGLKISWEFAGMLVCLEYVVGTQIWHLMFFLNGVPIVWD